jgi:glucosamine--fructose-6-phosphate aminotransferase (isomerizing)
VYYYFARVRLGEMVVATRDGYTVSVVSMEGDSPGHRRQRSHSIVTIEMDVQAIEKGGYDHFMLKEIMAQPQSLRDCMRGRIDAISQTSCGLSLGGLEGHKAFFISGMRRIIICACGTSWHAALVGEYLIEKFARVPVEGEYFYLFFNTTITLHYVLTE